MKKIIFGIMFTGMFLFVADTAMAQTMNREQVVYTGCGYTYKTKDARDTQCGRGGTSKWIGDGVNESTMTREQVVYTGCGYTYASKNARDKQCGRGGTSKWIPDPFN